MDISKLRSAIIASMALCPKEPFECGYNDGMSRALQLLANWRDKTGLFMEADTSSESDPRD